MSEIQIKLIPASETWDLRHRVLRPTEDIEACKYPQDDAHGSFHLGAFLHNELVGVASFHLEKFEALNAKTPYRLRGMATEPRLHKQGAGRALLEEAMEQLLRRDCDLLWCNAREVAFRFYEKLGFSYYGPMFDLPKIGPHKVMYKFLK